MGEKGKKEGGKASRSHGLESSQSTFSCGYLYIAAVEPGHAKRWWVEVVRERERQLRLSLTPFITCQCVGYCTCLDYGESA